LGNEKKSIFPITISIFLRNFLLILVFLLFIFYSASSFQDKNVCHRVIDGDTIELDNGEHVRLIGIDAPELDARQQTERASARQARDALRSLIEGQVVRLEYEDKKRDSFGRLLAYVYTQNNVLVNSYLLDHGLVKLDRKYVFHLYRQFEDAESIAQKQKRGLWGARAFENRKKESGIRVFVTASGKKYHMAKCRYLNDSKKEISLEDACSRGYSPCSFCKPPRCK